jgi:hypothetical protein
VHRQGIASVLLLLGACMHEGSALHPSAAEVAVPPSIPASSSPSTPVASVQEEPAPHARSASAPPEIPPQPTAGLQIIPAPAEIKAAPPVGPTRSGASSQKPSQSQTASTSAVPAVVPPPSPPSATPALDLNTLEQRLRDTHAIGLFTKLSLKNQVDDLLAQFKAFHAGDSKQTLAQLRQSFEVLLLKVVTLLQDDDPSLAAAVSSSRDAIWRVLIDPKKFANI